MSNAVATTETKALSVRERIVNATPEFGKALPAHIPAEKFQRTVLTALTMNPDIARAASQTSGGMQSLLTACTKAATDGLIIDGREAALVTFNQKVSGRNEPDKYEARVQYIPMVAGLMKKARNSGEIAAIGAHVVYSKDKFTYVLGDDERIEHAPDLSGERGVPIAVYAIVRLKDGSVQREVMDKAAVMRIASQSKNSFQYDPAKGKNYGEWWRKTVIRRISKYLPSSSDRDEFMQAVERIDEDYDFDPEIDTPAAPLQQAPKKRGGAASALKNVTPTERKPEPKPEADDAQYEEIDPNTGEVIDNDDPDMQPGDDI